MWIFDSDGAFAVLLSGTGRFITPDGRQIGWLDGNAVFNPAGRQVGWFSDGLLRDLIGEVSGFTSGASSTTRPILPAPRDFLGVLSLPVSAARPSFPPPADRPANRAAWSTIDPVLLFRGAGLTDSRGVSE